MDEEDVDKPKRRDSVEEYNSYVSGLSAFDRFLAESAADDPNEDGYKDKHRQYYFGN